MRKDNQQRQEVERAKRKIETELNDLKEQVGEKKMQVRLIKIDVPNPNGYFFSKHVIEIFVKIIRFSGPTISFEVGNTFNLIILRKFPTP